MNITYLIQMLQNKITILNNAKSQAVSVGDINQVNQIDQELLDTQNTFSQLTMLADMTQAAVNANSTPAALVASAIVASQNQTQGPSASAIINGYDVSAYATDPLYEQKIQDIINAEPPFYTAEDVDTYIQSFAAGSLITGAMIFASAVQYAVDIPLLVAIMQNDSNFGTLGIGATTNNPGNVGNTGYATQSYPSWADGVNAVADWLNRHRAIDTSTLSTASTTAATN